MTIPLAVPLSLTVPTIALLIYALTKADKAHPRKKGPRSMATPNASADILKRYEERMDDHDEHSKMLMRYQAFNPLGRYLPTADNLIDEVLTHEGDISKDDRLLVLDLIHKGLAHVAAMRQVIRDNTPEHPVHQVLRDAEGERRAVGTSQIHGRLISMGTTPPTPLDADKIIALLSARGLPHTRFEMALQAVCYDLYEYWAEGETDDPKPSQHTAYMWDVVRVNMLNGAELNHERTEIYPTRTLAHDEIIQLERTVYDADEKAIDTQTARVMAWTLPEKMSGGRKVPKKYHKELARARG